jgi:hypothetical protein
MPKAKSLITTLIFIILLAVDCFGNAVITEFTVLSWQEVERDELEIKIIDPKDIEKVVHIRFILDVNGQPEINIISKTVVRNSSFEEVRIIENSQELKKIATIWNSLQPIENLPNTNWTHKLDIYSNGSSELWLYNQEGYLSKLNYLLRPSFKVHNLDEFNKLLLGF